MNMPLSLPDWLPWWALLLALLPAVLFLLAFLAMPFSVLSLKSRLEAIEERLDEIQGEVRALSLRLPEHAEPPVPIPPARTQHRQFAPPPEPDDEPPARRPPVSSPARRLGRSEPRVDWPR